MIEGSCTDEWEKSLPNTIRPKIQRAASSQPISRFPPPLSDSMRRVQSDGSRPATHVGSQMRRFDSDEDTLWDSASKFQGFAPEGSSDDLSVVATVGAGEKKNGRCPNGIARLVIDMRKSLLNLTGSESGIATSPSIANCAIEKAAILIYESMSAPNRTFHDVRHVFDLLDFDADSIQTLAAFFHDAIYYSVDGGLSDMQANILEGVIVEEEDEQGGTIVRLSSTICDEDRQIFMVIRCFGFEPGQILNPFHGLNEILSAAVAVRILSDVLGDLHLLQIAACIEATIPFRKPDENGNSCSQLLYERLGRINSDWELNMTDDEVVEATKKALTLANMDVINFSSAEHGHFLSNTWKLLPENNITLRTDGASYISNFALALQKMLNFLQVLDPTSIYASFQNEPSAQEMEYLTAMAKANLRISTKYLQLKLLGISVVAALAELTGGDAPLIMFVRGMQVDVSGDRRDSGIERELSLRGSLPAVAEDEIHDDVESATAKATKLSIAEAKNNRRGSMIPNLGVVGKSISGEDRNEEVYGLLKFGRTSTSKFDIINSPLAAYLYGQMGDTGASASLKYCVCPMDKVNAKLLLDSIPPEAVTIIAKSCSKTALTRAESLLDIAKTYRRKKRQTTTW